MKKSILFTLMLSFLIASCGKGGGGSDSSASSETDVTAPPIVDGGEVPDLAKTFGTNIGLIDFTATQEEKYNQAVEVVKLVVATEEFKSRVLNHTYNGAKQFANNNGKTNAQIYQSILEAAETLRPAKNNTMDLEVELYYADNNVVGYTYTSVTQIWVNTKFFNQYAVNSVSGNLFHEWLHKLGYGHDSDATARRPYSVPYAIGYIIRDIGQDFL